MSDEDDRDSVGFRARRGTASAKRRSLRVPVDEVPRRSSPSLTRPTFDRLSAEPSAAPLRQRPVVSTEPLPALQTDPGVNVEIGEEDIEVEESREMLALGSLDVSPAMLERAAHPPPAVSSDGGRMRDSDADVMSLASSELEAPSAAELGLAGARDVADSSGGSASDGAPPPASDGVAEARPDLDAAAAAHADFGWAPPVIERAELGGVRVDRVAEPEVVLSELAGEATSMVTSPDGVLAPIDEPGDETEIAADRTQVSVVPSPPSADLGDRPTTEFQRSAAPTPSVIIEPELPRASQPVVISPVVVVVSRSITVVGSPSVAPPAPVVPAVAPVAAPAVTLELDPDPLELDVGFEPAVDASPGDASSAPGASEAAASEPGASALDPESGPADGTASSAERAQGEAEAETLRLSQVPELSDPEIALTEELGGEELAADDVLEDTPSAAPLIAVAAPTVRAAPSNPPPRLGAQGPSAPPPGGAPAPAIPPPPPAPVVAAPPAAPAAAAAPAAHVDPPTDPRRTKKKGAWWEDLFNDDYLRTVPAPHPRQVARQCDFIESRLGLVRGATLLDVGCGLGLHAIELTRRGYLVVGLDLSLPMLSRAADEAQDQGFKINFLHADMREMNFEGAFDAVLSWGTSFGYFDDDVNRAVLERIHRALKPGGLLLLDLVNRDYVIRTQPNNVWFEGDGCVVMEETQCNYISSRLQVKRTVMLDDGRQRESAYAIRLYSLHELGQMLHQRFRVVEVSGREATPGVFFGADSPKLLVVAERRLAPQAPPAPPKKPEGEPAAAAPTPVASLPAPPAGPASDGEV